MAQMLDRVTAAKYGVRAFINLSPDALVVVDLNNAAVCCGKGKFFHLPELIQAAPAANPNRLHIRSTIPNLIYLPHQWSQNEKETYRQLSPIGRFASIQEQLPLLNQEDVIPINLVIHPRGNYKTNYNFSWPKRTLATIVVLYTSGRMQIASMAEWADIASISADGNTYTVQFWTKDKNLQKYHETADAIGKKLEVGGILAELEKKVPQFHGIGDDDGTKSWATVKAALAHEAGNTVGRGPAARPMPSPVSVGQSTPQTPSPLRMPPPPSVAESARQTLPMRSVSPSSSSGKFIHRAQVHPVLGADDGLEPLLSPSAIFIKSQLAVAEVSDEHYNAKVNTSPTKKRRVTPVIKLED